MRISAGKSFVAVLALALPLGLAIAESPARKKKAVGQPNIATAQKLAAQAHDKLEAARKANEYDHGGHAAKAKAFLRQAHEELEAALANEK